MQVKPGMKPNKKSINPSIQIENLETGEEHRGATWLFYLSSFSNLLLCFFYFIPLSHINVFLIFLLPYLYFSIRLALYKIWYRLGYRPLPERRYHYSAKGGMHLPVFTRCTACYVQLRKQQSIKYQIIYNIYKVSYRTLYGIFFAIFYFIFTATAFTEDNRYPGSPLEQTLEQLSGGNESIEKIMFIALIMVILFVAVAIYMAGKLKWQEYFYRRYPVKILLVERDEPILAINN